MIKFDRLNITPDGKHIIIEARVENLDYYKNVSIDSVIIDTLDTFMSSGPSSKAIYILEFEGEEKYIKLTLDSKDLGVSLDKTLLFIYVKAKGYPAPETPCGYDSTYSLGVISNLYPYYQAMMNGIKEISNTCEVPKSFIDNILKFKAFELSIKTCNYMQAIEYWNQFFSSKKLNTVIKSCGCHA